MHATKQRHRRLALVVVSLGLVVAASAFAASIVGTNRADTLRGTKEADLILGKGGNDVIYGLAGNDRITPGPGRDRVYCGSGVDRVVSDGLDKVAADCEKVTRPTPPKPPPPATPAVTVAVTGSPQVAFDWTTSRCAMWDIPDLSARAFRDASGQVNLIASHDVTRVSVGSDLDHLRHDCSIVFGSHRNPDPAAFDDAEWIAATYTLDGTAVHALVHSEYHGWDHGQCPSTTPGRCWWNSVTSARSTDGGHTYVHSKPPSLVATYPYRYVPDRGTFGAMMPSNIVLNDHDDYYYALVYVKEQPQGAPNTNHLCPIRTKNLADPSSWRAWSGGTTFSTTFIDPYRSTANAADHLCRGVSPDELRDFPLGSLTFVPDAKQWLLVGVGGEGDGFYYSTSTDLINWSPRKLFLRATTPWTYQCGGPDPVHYPSLLDPASASRNFETVGKTAYLYYTQFHTANCQQGPDRDLVRVPVAVTR